MSSGLSVFLRMEPYKQDSTALKATFFDGKSTQEYHGVIPNNGKRFWEGNGNTMDVPMHSAGRKSLPPIHAKIIAKQDFDGDVGMVARISAGLAVFCGGLSSSDPNPRHKSRFSGALKRDLTIKAQVSPPKSMNRDAWKPEIEEEIV